MSIAARDWAWEQDLPPVTKIVLLALAERADDSGACWPSLNAIAKHCHISRPTVCSHLDKLETAGLLQRERRIRENGSQRSNRYQLALVNPDTVSVKNLDTTVKDFNRTVKLGERTVKPSLPLEPSLEPSLLSSPILSESPKTRAARSAKKPVQQTVDEITAELVLAYAGRWTAAQVGERIAYALNHSASTKWLNRDIGLRRWLKRDAETEDAQRAAPPHRNGSGPAPPAQNKPPVTAIFRHLTRENNPIREYPP